MNRVSTRKIFAILIFLIIAVTLVYSQKVRRSPTIPQSVPVRASYYSNKFENKLMANGHPYHGSVMSAASRKFPLGTSVVVTSVKTHKSVVLTITDAGPWNDKFSLDLSPAAFLALGLDLKDGWGWVVVKRMQ